MTDSDDAGIINGLGAFAVSYFEMGWSRDRVREHLITNWDSLGRLPGAFGAAAAALSSFPQPIQESAAKTERMRPIRERLGVQSADEQLLATIEGRELLQELFAEFD